MRLTVPDDVFVRLYCEDKSDLSEDEKNLFDETNVAKKLLKTLLSLFHGDPEDAEIVCTTYLYNTSISTSRSSQA